MKLRTKGLLKHATLILTLALPFVGAVNANADLGLDFQGSPPIDPYSAWNLGFEFRANANVTVTGLGNVDLTGQGYSQPQQVGLWTSSGILLASTYVGNSDPLTGNDLDWRFHSISPVTLVAGQTYVVGGQGGADYAGNTPVNVDPNITYLEDRYTFIGDSSNNPLVIPSLSVGYSSPSDAGWFGGNLEFGTQSVPEPASLTLFGMGAIGLLLRVRRRRTADAAV